MFSGVSRRIYQELLKKQLHPHTVLTGLCDAAAVSKIFRDYFRGCAGTFYSFL
jgi:hypothetical protein